MIATRIRRGVVYWQDSARGMASGIPTLDRECYNWHGVGLKRHNSKLAREIARLLRSAPKKHNRHKGHLVNHRIFPMSGVTSTWW